MIRSRQAARSALVVVVLGSAWAGLAYSQLAPAPAPASRAGSTAQVFEFTHQEVQAATIVATLNEISKQGWDVFQVIPTWTIKNDDGATELNPRSYQVFARRPANPAK